MALAYTTVMESLLSRGIDQRSAENLLAEGFSEDLLNIDIVEKRIGKRAGYQGHSGCLPLRATAMSYQDSGDRILISFNTAVDVSSIESTPILIYGRTSMTSGGDFTATPSMHYYNEFDIEVRKSVAAGTGTTTLSAEEHETGGTTMFVGMTEATGSGDLSNSLLIPDKIELDQSTFDVDYSYTFSSATTFFTYFLDRPAISGETYINSSLSPLPTSTISAATHQLGSFNMIPQFYRDTGSDWEVTLPDSLKISSSGDVTYTIIDGDPTPQNHRLILTAAPVGNVFAGQMAASGPTTFNIPAGGEAFLFPACYIETVATGEKTLIQPDSVVYNSTTDTHDVTLTNNSAAAENIEIYYVYGKIAANAISVESEAIISTDQEDTSPQITIWGLCHDGIYGQDGRDGLGEGWVNHIDSYQRSGEARLVSGLGGNLFRSLTYAEAAGEYNYASLYANLRGRISGDTIIGPKFWDTGEFSDPLIFGPSRGYITGDTGGNNRFEVDSAIYSSGSVRYSLYIPDKEIYDSAGNPSEPLGNVITAGQDRITVTQMGFERLSGEFEISAVADNLKYSHLTESFEFDSNYIVVDVVNSEVTSGDYDELDAGGSCGIFTDEVTVASLSKFQAGDRVLSELFTEADFIEVTESSGTKVVVGGVSRRFDVASGLRIRGRRSSSEIPLRDNLGVATVTDVVVGDTLSFTPLERELQVTAIDTAASTITIDEELTWEDMQDNSEVIQVSRRWIPIEIPATADSDISPNKRLPANQVVQHFDESDFGSQSFIRSTMVNDNMYLTNGRDEVMKFDGTNLYRAGLPRWQPGLFTSVVTGGNIDPGNITAEYTDAQIKTFTVASGAEQDFVLGDIIKDEDNGEVYTVEKIEDTKVIVDRAVVAGTRTSNISTVSLYRYYFRLNAVDANSNIIGSAVAGSEDFRVYVGEASDIKLRLIGLPNWHLYRYSIPGTDLGAIELQVYRTEANNDVDYFLVDNIPLDFSNLSRGYIDYTDSLQDSNLREEPLDPLSTLVFGELANLADEPPRASHITSADNRLVLANLSDYPELDIQILGRDTTSITRADLIGDVWKFLRDDTEAESGTDMSREVRYEYVDDSSKEAITGYDIGDANYFELTVGTDLTTPLDVGSWIYMYHDSAGGSNLLNLAGWWQIASVTATTIRVNYTHGLSSPTGQPSSFVYATESEDIPVYMGLDDYNRGTVGSNSAINTKAHAATRLAEAINVSMRSVDIGLVPDFTPWLIANAGNEFQQGQLLIRQPKVETTTFQVILPDFSTDYRVFVNGFQQNPEDDVSAATRTYPSRLVASLENYPEIFDNVNATTPSESFSVIDVNPADGQEITGIIPFFGDAAFGAAQKSGVVVVFKTNSIYLVDLSVKSTVGNPVQKLETSGQGCTAPYSISNSKYGITFANESGIYVLRRNLAVEYLGRYVERIWNSRVNRDLLVYAQGHNYNLGRRYKLSVPLESGTENSEVLVYHHTEETGEILGGWTRYDNHPSTGWVNLESDAFFASTNGRVFQIRRTGGSSDFRDDSSPINMEATFRAMDFGNSGIRKVVGALVVHYRATGEFRGTTLGVAEDLSEYFHETTEFVVEYGDVTDGLSDDANHKIVTISHSSDRRRVTYLQLRLVNNTIDEGPEIAGIAYSVAPMREAGIIMAGETE